MKNAYFKFASLMAFALAVCLFAHVWRVSKATSYFSDDPKACINCHVMNTHYATWQKSSHAGVAVCLDCHGKTGNLVERLAAKAMDGYHHGSAFTFNSYPEIIRISEGGKRRVQENCMSCHAAALSQTFLAPENNGEQPGRLCWECHREIPHGTVKGFTATPDAVDVKNLK